MLAKPIVCLLLLALGTVLCEEYREYEKAAANDETQPESTQHKKRRENVSVKIDTIQRRYPKPPFYPNQYPPPPYLSPPVGSPFWYSPYPLAPFPPRPPFLPSRPPVRPPPTRPSPTPPKPSTSAASPSPTSTPPSAGEFCESVVFLCNPGDSAIPELPEQFCALFEPSCRQSNVLAEESPILPWLCAIFPSHWMCPGAAGPSEKFCGAYRNHWVCASDDPRAPIERPGAIEWICENFPTDSPQWQCVDPITPPAGFCARFPTHWACLRRPKATETAVQRPPAVDAICQILPDYWMCQGPIMLPAGFCKANPNSRLCHAEEQSRPSICNQIPWICDVLPIANMQQKPHLNASQPATLLVKDSSEKEYDDGPNYYPTADLYAIPMEDSADRETRYRPLFEPVDFKRPLRRSQLAQAPQINPFW